jgi:hypothetical protein
LAQCVVFVAGVDCGVDNLNEPRQSHVGPIGRLGGGIRVFGIAGRFGIASGLDCHVAEFGDRLGQALAAATATEDQSHERRNEATYT